MYAKRNRILDDKYLLKFKDYEDYLESFITSRDLFHLRSKALSRRIIELGYHTPGNLDRESFYRRVKTAERYLYLSENPYMLCSENLVTDDILLQELAQREKSNRFGELYTIIFIRHAANTQSQISAFIDYNHRLTAEDWRPYFSKTKQIKPMKCDLAFYSWKTGYSVLTESPNFKPIIDKKHGLIFQNTHDSKLIHIDPTLTSETDPVRITLESDIYGRVVIYDHYIQNEEDEDEDENQ